MQLSKRLQAVADLVTTGNRVADIGCDHAYISIYLAKNKISPFVIAMDINQGPIDRAKANIIKYGCIDQIDARRSRGLEMLQVNEADAILIAGMGGNLTIHILSEKLDLVKTVHELILQPQSEIHLVRKYIDEIGFSITFENMIKEDGKYYVMMKAENSLSLKQKGIYDLTADEHFYFGRLLLEKQHPVLLEFLKKERRQCVEINRLLKRDSGERALQRQSEIEEKLKIIDNSLRYYDKEE